MNWLVLQYVPKGESRSEGKEMRFRDTQSLTRTHARMYSSEEMLQMPQKCSVWDFYLFSG